MRAFVSWKPSDQRQWYATGSEMMNASRPEIRCRSPAHGGADHGSFPKTHRALSTCTTANTNATVANQTFIAMVDEKKSVKTSFWLGSCTCPYTPSASATAAPMPPGGGGFT